MLGGSACILHSESADLAAGRRSSLGSSMEDSIGGCSTLDFFLLWPTVQESLLPSSRLLLILQLHPHAEPVSFSASICSSLIFSRSDSSFVFPTSDTNVATN
ncbi:hypothetical protein XENOCAPTIV_018511 [Xenoophorus captivus]|uniref:Uncharacterized protein n=1 Tax=Xenoophorus captivus TaxID=1517983 RepID=A0ABV0QAN6_9TELE